MVAENIFEKSVAVLEKDGEDEKKVGTAIDIQKAGDGQLTIEEAKGDPDRADKAIKSFEKTGEFYDEMYYDQKPEERDPNNLKLAKLFGDHSG